MTTCFWTVLIVVLQPLMANAQILHYQFNEGVGTTTSSSGSITDPLTLSDASGTPTTALWGAPGSGPSASAADRALDLTSATGMGSGFSGPNAFRTSLSSVPALDQFTITGWFRPSSTDLGRAELLGIQNGSDVLSVVGLSGGPVGARNRLRLIIDDGNSFPEVDAFGDFESQWSTLDVWAFFAISYNGQNATDTVTFYSGSVAGPVSLSALSSESAIQFPFGGASISIGARESHANPFKGYIDDFRLNDRTLSPTEVEQLRLEAVPEPGSVALLLLGTLILLRKWRRAEQERSSAAMLFRSVRGGNANVPFTLNPARQRRSLTSGHFTRYENSIVHFALGRMLLPLWMSA